MAGLDPQVVFIQSQLGDELKARVIAALDGRELNYTGVWGRWCSRYYGRETLPGYVSFRDWVAQMLDTVEPLLTQLDIAIAATTFAQTAMSARHAEYDIAVANETEAYAAVTRAMLMGEPEAVTQILGAGEPLDEVEEEDEAL